MVDLDFKYRKSCSSHFLETKEKRKSKELFLRENVHAVTMFDTAFLKVYHLVDSSTVLGYLHKPDSKLKPFEGTRVSEARTAGAFVE